MHSVTGPLVRLRRMVPPFRQWRSRPVVGKKCYNSIDRLSSSACAGDRQLGLLDGDAAGIDTAHLPGADAHGLIAVGSAMAFDST